jgi:predicted methyltransferase
VELDLRVALNAISDVVANRPQPLREFDQIYMKVGDFVVHAEFIARRFNGRSVVFVGDGDAIGLAIAHLMNEGVINYGPRHVTVLDFDERMVNSVNRFAAEFECADRVDAKLYNVVEPLPADLIGTFDAFHINPPWGQYNAGESVVLFLERAIRLTTVGGLGAVVIADDSSIEWTQAVLRRTQAVAVERGFVVEEMIPAIHSYHLDDAPELRSCTLILRKIAEDGLPNERFPSSRLANFYGRGVPPKVRYVRDSDVSRGRAAASTYNVEPFPEASEQ